MKSLQPFLAEQSWLHRFDEHVLVMGKKLAKKPLLPDLALDETEDGSVQLTATCEGHQVEVNLWPEGESQWDLDSLCDCDHGHSCPHAAAVLFLTAKPNTFSRLLRTKGDEDGPTSPTPSEAPPQLNTDKLQTDKLLPPTFHLHLTPEPVASKVTRLLLQALRQQDRDMWLVARPTLQYGPNETPLSQLPHETPFPRDPLSSAAPSNNSPNSVSPPSRRNPPSASCSGWRPKTRRTATSLTKPPPFSPSPITAPPTFTGHGFAPPPSPSSKLLVGPSPSTTTSDTISTRFLVTTSTPASTKCPAVGSPSALASTSMANPSTSSPFFSSC